MKKGQITKKRQKRIIYANIIKDSLIKSLKAQDIFSSHKGKINMNKITTKRRIHPAYNEVLDARKKGVEIRNIFGKYQYLYESNKGRISLISLPNYLIQDETLWEIYSLDGDLFEDVERFKTKKEAVRRIKELLK